MSILSTLLGDDYPSPAFRFRVAFSGGGGMLDTSFKSVTGIKSEIETEDVVEGGENRYVHHLPKTLKHPNLVLQRGIGPITSPMVIWCKTVFEADFILPIVPMPIMVFLLDEKGLPKRTWSFMNAYPVSWEIEEFNSTKNEVAIEKIELSYTYSNRIL